MEKKENLLFLLKSNHGALKMLLDDVSEEESMVRGEHDHNHIRWHTGHLIYAATLTLKTLDDEVQISEKWLGLFKGGSDVSDESADYPAMAELREKLYDLHARMQERVVSISDADLDRKVEITPGFESIAMNGALFFCTHEFYHAGQIANMRKIIGRERAFG
ncbi:MAG: DinB family protein [Candidatus Zixiibacteriota bacterium]|nr:MAG: DinB family protein [candidate division Zixibacteria bacterium]